MRNDKTRIRLFLVFVVPHSWDKTMRICNFLRFPNDFRLGKQVLRHFLRKRFLIKRSLQFFQISRTYRSLFFIFFRLQRIILKNRQFLFPFRKLHKKLQLFPFPLVLQSKSWLQGILLLNTRHH